MTNGVPSVATGIRPIVRQLKDALYGIDIGSDGEERILKILGPLILQLVPYVHDMPRPLIGQGVPMGPARYGEPPVGGDAR